MLNFLVLGIVPGTDFIITLKWVIGTATVLHGIALLKMVDSQAQERQLQLSQSLDTPTISTN